MKTDPGANTVTHPEGQGQYPESRPVSVETVPASSSRTKAEPAPSARCWPISCWTTRTRNWSAGATASAAAPITCRCTSGVGEHVMASLQHLMQRVREILKGGRGRNIRRVLEELVPVLCGWASYFILVDVKRPLEALDGWVRPPQRSVLYQSRLKDRFWPK